MDVHIGREQITSWKDFGVRYLLIVAGILSAWAVNQWNDSRQHRNIAEQTRTSLRAELGNDLDELRLARANNAREAERIRRFRASLVAALRAGQTPAQIEAGLLAGWDSALREELPSIRRDSWDAAVAGQAVTRLGADELRRFSAAYSALRLLESNGVGASSGIAGELLRRYTQWTLERELGRTDAVELARILVLWESLAQYNAALLRSVDDELRPALGAAAAAAASSPAR